RQAARCYEIFLDPNPAFVARQQVRSSGKEQQEVGDTKTGSLPSSPTAASSSTTSIPKAEWNLDPDMYSLAHFTDCVNAAFSVGAVAGMRPVTSPKSAGGGKG